tara:strand:- start:171 stop:449 length:279 start_codon:yes stop_codon:yes gene_type:complete
MNPTKTKPAKKKPAKYGPSFAKRNPVLSKLLDLKSRINVYREEHGNTEQTKMDRDLVFGMINKCKHSDDNTIHPDHMRLANGLWKRYETKSI